jgi:nitronate monooxygenase
MTKPIRAAAIQEEDPHGTNLWAGEAFREAHAGPAADIVTGLAPYIR